MKRGNTMPRILLTWASYRNRRRYQAQCSCFALFILLLLSVIDVEAQNMARPKKGTVSLQLAKSAAYLASGPDIILYNANVITLDDQQPAAEAIVIDGNMISAVGSDAEVLALQTANTMLYDLEGRTIVPGLIDAHGHRLSHAFMNDGLEGLVRATQEIAADGYTTTFELYSSPDLIAAIQELAAGGRLSVRVNCYIPYNGACGEKVIPWETHPYTEEKDTTLRVVGVKIFADGGSCGDPAITTLYQGGPAEGTYGNLWMTQAEMEVAVAEVLAAGYPIAMHAIGDSAVGVGLNAFEHAFAGGGNTLRSRMEHLRVMREDLVDQMAALGIGASIQYTWANALIASRWEAVYLPEVLEWAYPWRRMADRGIPIIGGTDFPSTSRSQAMHTISWLATRKAYADDIVPEWMAGDELTVEEGLRAMTVTNAWHVFEEDVKGSIVPGKLADLTILSNNPLEVDPFDVRDITIEMTIMDGIIRHDQKDIERTAIHDAGAFSMGFDDRGLWGPYRSNVGLAYNGSDHLYMGSLLIAYNEDVVATATPPEIDYITSFEGWIDFREPGTTADEEATVFYEDAAINHPDSIGIGQETFMWAGEPFLLVKYTFTNIGDNLLTDLYFGQFMDFDVVDWSTNMGRWEQNQGLGFAYMYNANDTNTPYIGVAMFDSSGKHANSALTFTTGIYPNSEPVFSEYMRSGTIESASPDPRDYAILITSQSCDLPAGHSKTPFTLAFMVGESLEDLKNAVNLAYQKSADLLDIDTRQDQFAPVAYILYPAYPNPFNPATIIRFDLPHQQRVQLIVYDIMGREVVRLVDEVRSPGYYEQLWSGQDALGMQVASGIYFAQLVTPEYTKSIKMLLLK
jgi:predicted amidohydrolase YtcJ